MQTWIEREGQSADYEPIRQHNQLDRNVLRPTGLPPR
jgi:hypothetical protein